MPFSRMIVRLLVIVAFAMVGGVLAEASGPAQGDSPTTPQECGVCHVDVVANWQGSAHANAYQDELFQETWQDGGSDPECLECHTTGFDAVSGEFHTEGVACEACHGETPANHPEDPVVTNPGTETCAECHATTFREWQMSGHGEQQLACTTCHLPHPQSLRFENATTLCLNCHDEEGRTDYVHVTHAEQQCVDCHWHRSDPEVLIQHYETGALFPTGHTAEVETVACVTCHEGQGEIAALAEAQEAEEELGLGSEHPLLEAQVRIQELEAELDTVDAQGANTSSLRLVQGVVIGAALGGLLMFVAARLSRRNAGAIAPNEADKDNG